MPQGPGSASRTLLCYSLAPRLLQPVFGQRLSVPINRDTRDCTAVLGVLMAGQQGLCCPWRLCHTPRAMCVSGCAHKYSVPPCFPSGAGPGWDSPFKRQSKLLVSLDKPKEEKKKSKTKLTAIKSRSNIINMLEYINNRLSHYHPCISH